MTVKPVSWQLYDFELVFNWVIELMIIYMREPLDDNNRIRIIRDAATIIFKSYEKELIGKTNVPAYEPKTVEEIINCRKEVIDLLDKFDKHEISGNYMENKLQRIRDKLRTLNK